jgi:hypothetical protein
MRVSLKLVVIVSVIIQATQFYVWDYMLQECVFHLVGAYDGIFPCQSNVTRRYSDHMNVRTTEHFIGISNLFLYILLIYSKRAYLCGFLPLPNNFCNDCYSSFLHLTAWISSLRLTHKFSGFLFRETIHGYMLAYLKFAFEIPWQHAKASFTICATFE